MRNEKGDFKKPGGRTVAMVDGARSYASYLSEMKEAWLNFQASISRLGLIKLGRTSRSSTTSTGRSITTRTRRWSYRPTPRCSSTSGGDLPRWKKVEDQIGPEPSRAGMDDLEYYMSDAYKDYRRKFMKSQHFMGDFEKHIGSSIIAPELVGNSYSVSVFVGLDSLLENDREDLTGKNVVLCGYGSGSHAVIQGSRIPEGYKEVAKKLDLMQRLSARKKLSIEEYEKIHEGEIKPEAWTEG